MTSALPEDHEIQNHFLASFAPEDCRPRVEDAVCYLGGPDYRPKPNILRRVDKALSLAEQVVAPMAAFAFVPVLKADHDGVILDGNRRIPEITAKDWHQAAVVVASVATLGPGLEEKCRALSQTEPFSAIVLDAVGVAFLDRLGQMVGRESRRQARMRGLYSGPRISPGLGQMDLHLQNLLFDLVDHQALGVELTEDLIMKPFKSISEFRALTSRPQEPAPTHKCMHCDLLTCGFRRSAPRKGHPDS